VDDNSEFSYKGERRMRRGDSIKLAFYMIALSVMVFFSLPFLYLVGALKTKEMRLNQSSCQKVNNNE